MRCPVHMDRGCCTECRESLVAHMCLWPLGWFIRFDAPKVKIDLYIWIYLCTVHLKMQRKVFVFHPNSIQFLNLKYARIPVSKHLQSYLPLLWFLCAILQDDGIRRHLKNFWKNHKIATIFCAIHSARSLSQQLIVIYTLGMLSFSSAHFSWAPNANIKQLHNILSLEANRICSRNGRMIVCVRDEHTACSHNQAKTKR